MRHLTFEDLLAGNRALLGSAEEVREKVEYVRERLYLTDLAGLFALGGLADAQARASMRRFMDRWRRDFRKKYRSLPWADNASTKELADSLVLPEG